jgi:D-alanine-D-alanine ligase
VKIGITYDLRDDYLAEGYGEEETAEFDHPVTIAAIEGALHILGHDTERIGHIRKLAEKLVAGEKWDLVFNIAEGLRGFGREAQVPALLEAYDIPYVFSDPLVLSLTLHKGMTKRVIRDLGIPTPDFTVVESPEEIERVALPFPLFAKPVAEGTGKGVTAASKINDRAELERVCLLLLETFRQPVLIEAFLPGREFTVGIIGTGGEAFVPGVL